MNTENNNNADIDFDKNNPEIESEYQSDIENEAYSYDLEDDAVEEAGLHDKLKSLRAELKAEKEKSTEYLTGWQKERASFANYKAEEEKTRAERIATLKTNLLADFFPVLDSFDMAFSNREAWEAVDPAWRTGVEYIHTQFMTVLDQYHISKINEINVYFDPLIHEPIEILETDDPEMNDLVAQIIQSGYKSGEIVIRPAKVNVYKHERVAK